MISRARVLDALSQVYDPELDEPITSLRFVTSCQLTSAGEVEVALRLPTPQCAPNFAYLMAADAREAVRRLPGVNRVTVTLEDHYTAREINEAVQNAGGFTRAFPGETEDDELGALRELFLRKALIARQSRLCEALLARGETPESVITRRLAEMPDGPDSRRCLELRERLGISSDPDSPAFVSPRGEPLGLRDLNRWLRAARLVRTSLEANGGICRSLLQIRHHLAPDPEEVER